MSEMTCITKSGSWDQKEMAGRIWCNLLNETRIVKGALQLNRENLSNVSTAMDFSFLITKLFLFTVGS